MYNHIFRITWGPEDICWRTRFDSLHIESQNKQKRIHLLKVVRLPSDLTADRTDYIFSKKCVGKMSGNFSFRMRIPHPRMRPLPLIGMFTQRAPHSL